MAQHRYWRFIFVEATITHSPRTCEIEWIDKDGIARDPGASWSFNADWTTFPPTVGGTCDPFDQLTNVDDICFIAGYITVDWIKCDYGSPGYDMRKFRAYSSYGGAARGAKWSIEFSDDDVNWTRVVLWTYETVSPYTGWYEVEFPVGRSFGYIIG